MDLLIIYFMYMFMSGVLVFLLKRKHLIMTLLSLEYLMLMMYVILYFYLWYYDGGLYYLMMFLVFSVCEGVLGLSILVMMIRSHGNDYFQSYVVLRC
uniref:NADH-ubiquinone oxidoreductase chain 4L n=1 Tax=Ornebius bimaculatus TaxID=2153490 RepID=A0A385I204_9ORTH|nr:NADH dehydrogenase subunit 4L [Ornebius bimaculatus]AXY63933.1 NADH dehydrogenase subunit 4L [Ornebius bimaculatus]